MSGVLPRRMKVQRASESSSFKQEVNHSGPVGIRANGYSAKARGSSHVC